jgi:tetratricopeptide (TPR) repeat protein
VLEIQRRVLGEDRPETLRSMSQLAVILTARGKLDEAETLVHKALTEQRRALGDDDPETLTSLSILTQLLRQRGQLDAALAAGTELLERARRVFNPGHYQLGVYLANHGRTLLAMARYGEAKQLFDEAWSNLNQSGSGGQPHLAELAGSFVELYNRWHQSTQAGSDEAQASHWRRILDELERTAR